MPVVRFRDCDCGQNHRSRRRREPKDLANAGIAATAELVSVEPCLEPATCPSKPPPRHHAACQRGALFKRRCRRWPNSASIPTADRVPREHRPTRTSRDGGGGPDEVRRSGCQHGSTLTGSVVAGRSFSNPLLRRFLPQQQPFWRVSPAAILGRRRRPSRLLKFVRMGSHITSVPSRSWPESSKWPRSKMRGYSRCPFSLRFSGSTSASRSASDNSRSTYSGRQGVVVLPSGRERRKWSRK